MTSVAIDEFQQYRTPRENRTALVEPGIDELSEMLRTSTVPRGAGQIEFCGKSLFVARQQARSEVIQLACNYTSKYRDVDTAEASKSTRLVLSGHQPELFHSGVWFKNFLLSRLAELPGTLAINFLVDNDVCRSAAIRVPTMGTGGSVVAQSIPFDTQRDSVPWELRRLNSREVWEAFPQKVAQTMLPSAEPPLLSQMWPDAVESLRRSNRIGLAIAEARHKLEAEIGLSTLEVPLSALVSTLAFARFSIQLLSELPRFQDVYNSQLQAYRAAHQIRNHAHPVPALDQEAGWLEAPWWIYRAANPHRQKMWVRLLDNQLILSDRAGWQAVIEGRMDCDNAANQWLELQADGICVRPRALLTTMYLRIMVSDLFLHGIGGGKYDQLTNAIIREFFGIQPPPMAVATATLQLPIALELSESGSRSTTEERIRHARQRIWQMRFHSDQLSSQLGEEAEMLKARKRELLENIPQRGDKWDWHRSITAVNQRLRELAQDQIDQSKRSIEQLNSLERQQKILESREFSFCLFSKAFIAEALSGLCGS